jgi:hypothetical protein
MRVSFWITGAALGLFVAANAAAGNVSVTEQLKQDLPLEFGGSFPWESGPYKARVACSDQDNPVVFELRRVD